ncbi:sulfatase-like hydrolase/transferase, partial [Candidatus Woesearchaeota archaeon]|nr:sulfatase-like hydrolase/transferase [Candidatus Woesearchaeota archaeon]
KEAKRLTKELYGDKGDDGEFKTFSEKDITFLKERYDEEAKDTDEQLKEMVDKLKQLNKWDETLLIITADHGEAFGETGYMKHPLGEVSNLNHIRVPFIIAGGLAKDLDIKKANNGLIWNKDIYDIILGVADGQKQIQLKENDFVRGVRKKNTVFYIHALYDPVKKEIINPVPPA